MNLYIIKALGWSDYVASVYAPDEKTATGMVRFNRLVSNDHKIRDGQSLHFRILHCVPCPDRIAPGTNWVEQVV